MSANEALSGRQFKDAKFPHPDDWMFAASRHGRWHGVAQPVPKGYSGNPSDLPEGIYHMPTEHLRVTDPDRVRKKAGSALEGRIAAEGIKKPVHLDSRSRELVDGNHRVAAAINLGLPTVPTMVTHPSLERRRRFL